ncbi:hypothetical protein B0H11DRAFT_2235270 [Mycena galericulata]|nr:hypothetical protein B0H11DRAFT_2235270 [Mycena galericulata]
MPPTIAKTESQGDNPMDSDPYAAAAAALEQAQRALSTARGQPLMITVAEAEEQLNDLRSRIVGLEDDVDRYRRGFADLSGAAKERDDARTEVESKVRKKAHETNRVELAASVKEREGLQRERDDLTKDRECLDAECVALEAEKKTMLKIRTFIVQKLQSMDQLAAPNVAPQAPEPQVTLDAAMMSLYKSTVTSRSAATMTSDAAPSLILRLRRPAPESPTSQSAYPPKRQRTESPALTSTATARPTSRPRQVAPGPSTRLRVQQPHEGADVLALRAKIPLPFQYTRIAVYKNITIKVRQY